MEQPGSAPTGNVGIRGSGFTYCATMLSLSLLFQAHLGDLKDQGVRVCDGGVVFRLCGSSALVVCASVERDAGRMASVHPILSVVRIPLA